MVAYTVSNGSHLAKAFKVYGGFTVVKAGAQGEFEPLEPLTDDQIAAYARDGVKVSEKAAKAEKPLTDKQIVAGLNEADKSAYDALDADGKTKFLADYRATS